MSDLQLIQLMRIFFKWRKYDISPRGATSTGPQSNKRISCLHLFWRAFRDHEPRSSPGGGNAESFSLSALSHGRPDDRSEGWSGVSHVGFDGWLVAWGRGTLGRESLRNGHLFFYHPRVADTHLGNRRKVLRVVHVFLLVLTKARAKAGDISREPGRQLINELNVRE